MKTWDLLLFRRAGAFALGLTLAAFFLVAATDEGAELPIRIDRTAVLVPMLSAIAAWLALRGSARARGEVRALFAAGGSPFRLARAAVFGAALPVLLVLGWALHSPTLGEAFVPSLPSRALIGSGVEFRDSFRGLIVSTATGHITRMPSSAITPVAHAFFPWLALLVLAAAVVLSLHAALDHARRVTRDALHLGVWLFATIVLLHLAGIGRIALFWTLTPTLMEGAFIFYRTRRHAR